jgi:hypothetical protein
LISCCAGRVAAERRRTGRNSLVERNGMAAAFYRG